ncbi:glucan endo-1,3-beta-glucosidase 7-like isoform X1 [Zingiber officinale]|uniref:glucan endo-1,3-beta-glucosidase 7-like isoform X1 n=1 Tax=Zingiber officinale TaxID=94328 RepID=UPI001C4ABDD4|nr:glucan endo-1,3-beta-glucosidase 7-like isoform X1 [Zingiber officinale]
MEKSQLISILVLFQAFICPSKSQSFVGVNYGEVADNLPPASTTASLLQSTTISKLRLYGADHAIIQSLAGTGISLVLGVPNSDVPSLASDPAAAASWAASNVLPFVPASSISAVSVGNEALNSGDPSLAGNILPAMQNLRAALAAAPAAAGIKVTTVHSMAVMAQSDPPSAGAFHADLAGELAGMVGFLREAGSPFMVNPYPFFAYRSDPRPETLAFCLFQPNAGRVDPASGMTYNNMFDAQVDAVRAALDGLGFPEVEIVVAETGWPYKGDPEEAGTTVENAMAFNGNLVAHLRSMAGTPRMPGRPVETYIFALYDEDLKGGPTSERSFGLYRADGTSNYDAGLAKSGSTATSSPQGSASSSSIGLVQPEGSCTSAETAQQTAEECYPTGAGDSPAPYRMRFLFLAYGAAMLLLTKVM